MTEPAITVLFSERVGALDRIISLLRRRGFPITGMTVERTERQDVGRMTLVVEHAAVLQQVRRHLLRLSDVIDVTTPEDEAVRREYTLIRIRCTPDQQEEIRTRVSALDARIVSTSGEYLVAEASGEAASLDALYAEMAPYGIDECARTGAIVLSRTSPVTTAHISQ